ncbi:hypothetical protein LINGRAHAP2_LOCUS32763 [Linum grandiflorum]
MCGDFGFSSEHFQCQLCQFISQHKYYNNLYPKVILQSLNWCLLQQDYSKEKSRNSSNPSSSNHNNDKDQANSEINWTTSDNNGRKVLDIGLMMKAKDGGSNDRSSSQWQSVIDGPIKVYVRFELCSL